MDNINLLQFDENIQALKNYWTSEYDYAYDCVWKGKYYNISETVKKWSKRQKYCQAMLKEIRLQEKNKVNHKQSKL